MTKRADHEVLLISLPDINVVRQDCDKNCDKNCEIGRAHV